LTTASASFATNCGKRPVSLAINSDLVISFTLYFVGQRSCTSTASIYRTVKIKPKRARLGNLPKMDAFSRPHDSSMTRNASHTTG
jgi:hypothetical protein